MRLPALLGLVALVLGFVLLGGFVSGGSGAGSFPVVKGSRVVIDSGGHHLEGTFHPSPHQVLMKDEGVAQGTFAGDVFVTVMPMATAKSLRARYGDFFHCGGADAEEAMQSLQAVVFVAGNPAARQGLAQARDLVRKSQVPVVTLTGGPLQGVQQKWRGLSVDDSTGIPVYCVTSVRVEAPDYRVPSK